MFGVRTAFGLVGVMEKLKELINEERIMQGMTIKELTAKAGLSHHTGWKFLNGVNGGNLSTAESLAEALGCELTLKKK